MNLKNVLVLGASMIPREREIILHYDSCPLIGTFNVQGHTVLFWAADAPDEPRMRYVYSLLTDAEVQGLGSYFQPGGSSAEAYKDHPLLSGRRIVIGLSDEKWNLAQVVVLERSTKDVFAEVEKLFPVG